MTSQYTPRHDPKKLVWGSKFIGLPDGVSGYKQLAQSPDGQEHNESDSEWQTNARRFVACWNACDGISTESLEKNGPFAEILEARDAAIAGLDDACKKLQLSPQKMVTPYISQEHFDRAFPNQPVSVTITTKRLPKMKLLMLTTAYEQGVGKGIQRVNSNPYAVDTDEHEAWDIGYREGLDKPAANAVSEPQAQGEISGFSLAAIGRKHWGQSNPARMVQGRSGVAESCPPPSHRAASAG